MSDDIHPTPSAEKGGRSRSGLKGKLRWWFIDLWYIHVIILIVVVLCVTLPLVYVGYPRIAQHDVNAAKLNLTQLQLTKPAPQGFHLNLTTELHSDSSFHPSLKAWNASVYLDGAKDSFMTLPVPPIAGKTGSLANYDGTMKLNSTQLDAFTEYVKTLTVNDTVTVRLRGRGPLKLGALPTVNVNYNKKITQDGLGGLSGVTISQSKLLTAPQPDNATLSGRVNIPNKSSGLLELGNLTFGLSLPASVLNTDNPTPLGYATVNNTILKPHSDNFFDLRSVANQSLVLNAVSKNATFLQTGLPITIVTRKVEYNGEEIPWLTKALASQPLTQMLNLTEILASGGGGGGLGPKGKVKRLAKLWNL